MGAVVDARDNVRVSEEVDFSVETQMSKTLHSGLRVLEFLRTQPEGLTVTEVADGIGVHRTVAHRFLRTLEHHRLVRRDRDKRFHLGHGLVSLAEPVDRDLRSIAKPILVELADTAEATAHLVVQEDADHVRALLVVEPTVSSVHIAYPPGQRDRISAGSAGLAILASRPPQSGERVDVAQARERGYALSFGEVIPSVHGLSVAVPGREPALAVGVSVFDFDGRERLSELVTRTAAQLSVALS